MRISTLLAAAVLAAIAVPSLASVCEDQRACEYGYLKTLQKGASPPQTTNPAEQYCLGLAYWFQPSPFPRDPALVARWYEAAAAQGHAGAMVAWAYQFEKGQGVGGNVGKAFDLYERAAKLGSSDAMFNVFRLYTTGKGVKADPEKARTWLVKAAAAGSIDAERELASVARGTDSRPGIEPEASAHGRMPRRTILPACDSIGRPPISGIWMRRSPSASTTPRAWG